MIKNFEFVNTQSLKEFKELPERVQLRFANDLNEIRNGKEPYSQYNHLKESVGVGAIELIENGRPAFRTIYIAKFNNTVYILHSFTKTTNGVDRRAMDTAAKRYKQMVEKINKI